MNRLRSLGTFAWDFVIGDDWRIALGVVVALALTALAADAGMAPAWWIVPVATVTLLTASLWRAARGRTGP
jgi:hypothetical protein